MDQTIITVVIAGEAYKLDAGDSHTLAAIPAPRRQQLISLLEALRQEDASSRERVARLAAATAPRAGSAAQQKTAIGAVNSQATPVERMGSGDVDALMARLVMEDNNARKPAPDKSLVYKVLAGVAILLLLAIIW